MSRATIFKAGLSLVFLFTAVSTAGAVDDGFAAAKKIDSQHFTIYLAPNLDIPALSQQLNIQPADELIVGQPSAAGGSAQTQFAQMLDTLFMRVCEILDMQLYSFRGNIKICQDQAQLERLYRNLFSQSLSRQSSFYVYSQNTIYISADAFQRGILGHEIGHAVISRYFVVSPSVKIQEVLAGYVEYQLRKE